MPQKDTALIIARAARSFITECNRQTVNENGRPVMPADEMRKRFLLPRFPLYAFLEKLPDEGITSCRIEAAEGDGNIFYFPVHLAVSGNGAGNMENTIKLKIIFAELQNSISDGNMDEGGKSSFRMPENYENKGRFPLTPRVFRIGRYVAKGNAWEIWDEKWQKLSKRG